MFALAALLWLSQAADAEVFTDHGQLFVREGERAGLRVGTVVELFDARGMGLGRARVSETYEALAKLEADPGQAKVARRARFGLISEPPLVGAEGAVVTQRPTPEQLDREPTPPPDAPPVQGDVVAERAEVGPSLDGGAAGGLFGEASVAGLGPMKRITVYNRSKLDWHRCEVRLPNNRRFKLGNLQAESSEGILWFRFEADGEERDVPLDSVTVRCSEGAGRFVFSM